MPLVSASPDPLCPWTKAPGPPLEDFLPLRHSKCAAVQQVGLQTTET